MNQIYACREGRKRTFTDAKISGTATTNPTRSVSRAVFTKLLLGVFLFLVVGAAKTMAQSVVTFNTQGTYFYVVPPGVTSITFDVTGSGGGGAGSDAAGLNVSGGGGAGGSFQRYLNVPVTPGATLTIVVGSGGLGGAAGAAGGSGGITSIAALGISHAGGAGGAIAGGATGSGGHDQVGGDGGDGEPAIAGSDGGGGGGAGTLATNGTNGNDGAAGGAGGATGGGAGGLSAAGGNATANGGGGGGAGTVGLVTSFGGGAGGAGMVVLRYTCATYSINPVTTPVCINAGTQNLTGAPAFAAGINPGPLFAGPGVQGAGGAQVFNPAVAGAGAHNITYSWTDAFPGVPACVTSAGPVVITVQALPTLTLTSGVGTTNQNVCINNPITNITYTAGGGATGVSVTGLPPGVTNTGVFPNVVLSGSPTAAGVFNYTVTTTPAGPCTPVSLNGTITVQAVHTLTLTSAVATTNQNVCINTPITNITYTAGGGATGVTVAGLPAGVTNTGVFPNVVLSGTPTVAGVFNYTVTTTPGGPCPPVALNGTITVQALPTLVPSGGATTQTVCAGSPITTVNLTAGGGATGVVVSAGAIPAGMALGGVFPNFTVSGSPTNPGVFTFSIATTPAGPCPPAIVNFTINSNTVPATNDPANIGPVCCNAGNINVPFSIANAPALPAGGVLAFNWTNDNPLIGLAANGTTAGNAVTGLGTLTFAPVCNIAFQTANLTVTATYTFNGVTCTGPTQNFTIQIFPSVDGTIVGSGTPAICAGQNADINIDLTGTPNFTSSFSITPIVGIGLATPVWNWPAPGVTVNGPSSLSIPSALLPNGSSAPTVYRVAWSAGAVLTDGNGCTQVNPLTGFTDITVYPLPTIAATRNATVPAGTSAGTQICPGTNMVFNVTNPNVIPGTLFNWIARDNAGAGATLGSANNVAFGSPALTTNLGLVCPTTHINPIRFTFTPIGPGPLGCVGVPVSIDVWVGDNTAPVLAGVLPGGNLGNTCLAAVPAAPSIATIRALYTDNCTSTPSLVVTQGATNTVGNNCGWTVTYPFTVTDACGNATAANVVYTGADTQAPTWTTAVGSLNTTIECTNNAAAFAAQLAVAQGWVPLATDNCATAGTLNTNRVKVAGTFAQAVPGTCVSEGTYTNTFFTNDGCGNSSIAFTQVITIEDNTAPTLGNPGTQTIDVGAGAGCMAPLPDYRGLVSYTDCTPISPAGLIQSPAPGTMVVGAAGPGPVGGSVTVQITAQDGCGNSTTISFLVNITDATPPIARCHNVTINLDATGNATMVPSFIDGNKNGVPGNGTTTPVGNPWILSSDNCGVQFVRFTPANTGVSEPFPSAEGNSNVLRVFKCNDVGANNITLQITDYNGNVSTCPAVVTIVDVTPPVISCAPTQTFQKNATCVTILPNLVGVGGTTATDACGILSITQSPAAGSIIAADVASLVVTFTATDVNGNVTTCTSTMLFRDQTPPVITGCPAPITVFTGAGNTDCQLTLVWTPPTATDNCSPILGNTILTSTHLPAGPATFGFPGGGFQPIPDDGTTTQTTLNVTGVPPGSTVQSVTINGIQHTFPADIDMALTSPLGTSVILMSDLGGATDLTGESYTFRDGFPALTTGYNATGTYNPSNSGATDNFPAPGPGSLTQGTPALANFGAGNMNGLWTLNIVDDLGGDAGSINNWGITFFNPAVGGTPFFVGTTNVVYTATDAAGNTSTCTFPVTVIDNTLPVITCNSPGPKTVNATASCQYTHSGTTWDATGTDNCIPIIQATYQLTGATNVPFNAANTSLNGRVFNLGTTTVTWRVVDQSTNSTTCSFTVTVVDTQVPSLTCPANVAINSNTANCAAVVPVAQLTPVFSDNCAVTLVEWSVSGATPISSGIGSMGNYTFSLGTSLVTFRVHDAAGNSTLCTFNVVVTNALAGAISGNATAAQNAATTSTITFTGSGAPASPTTTYTFGYNVNGGPTQFVTTGAGSNVVTVAQSNAVVGTFVYTLTSVTANNMPGCAGAVTAPPTATINVVFGQPDLTNSQFFSTTQIAAGGVIDEVVSIRNVGTAATSGPIVFTVTNYAAITGLSAVSNTNPSVTIGFTTYTLDNANWTITSSPSALTFTSNVGVVINPGATRFLGVRINRAAGANGTVTHSSTITGGTGGGETPTNNNSISNTLLKN